MVAPSKAWLNLSVILRKSLRDANRNSVMIALLWQKKLETIYVLLKFKKELSKFWIYLLSTQSYKSNILFFINFTSISQCSAFITHINIFLIT